ncbi:MAG: hypothetical protein GWP41_06670 [Planctomycetia bacterium]|jgi:biopolymer transport protein ExbD|nr:hypothetical protein [Planctomycetia bacterium]NCF98232.1 hypothetical protein [Planctomycetia bacterium]NCG13741.1 hypothetical protein [Planctomycetia bacterium]
MTATKNSRFRRRRQIPRWGDVLAPLLDVIFLLVIFLLVSASFDDTQLIEIQLPKARGSAEAQPSSESVDPMILVLMEDRKIRWRDQFHTLEDLLPLLDQMPEESRLRAFTIQTDRNVDMETGLQVLGELQNLGWSSVEFEVSPLTDPSGDLEPRLGEG